MATIKRFEDLEIWQLARKFENEIWVLNKSKAFKNDFRFIDQICGSTGSAMDNIAEGFGRASRLEFVNSLSIAKGEVSEAQSQLYRGMDRGYINGEEFDKLYKLADELINKIAAFIQYLNKSNVKGQKFNNRIK